MQKMFTVKSYQKKAEEVEDPIVTDLLEHTDPRISEIQSKIVQKRLKDAIGELNSKKTYIRDMRRVNLLKLLDRKIKE